MKKIALTINDIDYEKFALESLKQKKSIQEVIKDRIFERPFDQEILQEVEKWMDHNFQSLLKE